MSRFRVEGRVAVITGGGTGIGRGSGLVLAEHGADVVLAGRRREPLEETARDVEALGRRSLVVPTDVTVPDQCQALVDATLDRFGRLDILVNNAGGAETKGISTWSEDEYRQTLALNLDSVWFLSRMASRPMLEQGHGTIVNITSGASLLAMPQAAGTRVYRRLRDEAPLHRNEEIGFWGLSRHDDVEAALRNTTALSSAKGDILEVVLADPVMPPGVFINEDPPLHTVHRALVSRAFTPRRMRAVEDQIRAFCAACLDPLVGHDRFDFVLDLGAELPMRAIGMLMGIPDSEIVHVRDAAAAKLRNEPGKPLAVTKERYFSGKAYAEYVEWRAKNPSDDLITELLSVEFEDVDGEVRRLTQEELLTFVAVIAGAGVETTGRLFGWMGKVLAEHPDQRRELVEDRSLVPAAIEELLRFEPPGPHVARYVANDVTFHGQTVPAGSAMLLMLASANRDERRFDDPDRYDIHRRTPHLTFGHGTHYCLGAALARMEGRIALEEVLERWPSWEIDLDAARRAPTSTVRGWDSMPAAVG